MKKNLPPPYPAGDRLSARHKHLVTEFPMHWHRFYEIELTLSGEGRHTVGSHEYRLCHGEIHIIRPTDMHAISPHGELDIFYISIPPAYLDEGVLSPLLLAKGDLVAYLNEEDTAAALSLCTLLQKKSEGCLPYERATAKALLQARIFLLLAARGQGGGAAENEGELSRILLFLQNNFRRPLTLLETAEHFGFSPAYFSRYFKESFGTSFKETLSDMRLLHAEKLVRHTNNSLLAISRDCGYGSLSTFLRDFKHRFGKTPKEMRRT